MDGMQRHMRIAPTGWLEPGSVEWDRAWQAVADAQPGEWRGNPVCTDEASGETWQYMGLTGDGAAHFFRHRMHPAFHGERRFLRIPLNGEPETWQR